MGLKVKREPRGRISIFRKVTFYQIKLKELKRKDFGKTMEKEKDID